MARILWNVLKQGVTEGRMVAAYIMPFPYLDKFPFLKQFICDGNVVVFNRCTIPQTTF